MKSSKELQLSRKTLSNVLLLFSKVKNMTKQTIGWGGMLLGNCSSCNYGCFCSRERWHTLKILVSSYRLYAWRICTARHQQNSGRDMWSGKLFGLPVPACVQLLQVLWCNRKSVDDAEIYSMITCTTKRWRLPRDNWPKTIPDFLKLCFWRSVTVQQYRFCRTGRKHRMGDIRTVTRICAIPSVTKLFFSFIEWWSSAHVTV